jgi:hypothetical protein
MAASDKTLGALHEKLAIVLSSVLDGRPVADAAGNVTTAPPSAAEMAVIVGFLKNNNITASAADNAGLAALREKLAEKRKERKASMATLSDAADSFKGVVGDMMQ